MMTMLFVGKIILTGESETVEFKTSFNTEFANNYKSTPRNKLVASLFKDL